MNINIKTKVNYNKSVIGQFKKPQAKMKWLCFDFTISSFITCIFKAFWHSVKKKMGGGGVLEQNNDDIFTVSVRVFRHIRAGEYINLYL